ncbi:MAG: hypothetical protein IPK44_12645 [Candidatus Accumulibacter sp.]|nr:hypothetical protein [Accumulibacter sp.]MBK8115314.1 hypothetical protein [Accumulibacter sp.]
MGYADIVRELVQRGAKVNTADNSQPTSPLSMAIRGNRTEVVKIPDRIGAEVPPNMETGLTKQEMMIALARAAIPERRRYASSSQRRAEPVFEEIEMVRCYGADTAVLDADMIRAARKWTRE